MLNNTLTLQQLEEITEITYKNPTKNPERTQNLESIGLYYKTNLESLTEILEILVQTKTETCQFWSFNLLIEICSNSYTHLSAGIKEKIRLILNYIFTNLLGNFTRTNYIFNKFCVLYITWMRYDYLNGWTGALLDPMNIINNTTDQVDKYTKSLVFAEILLVFNEDIVLMRNCPSEVDTELSMAIKDHIRENSIQDLLEKFLFVNIYDNLGRIKEKKDLITRCIKVIAQLIDWNDLAYFSNFVSTIFGYLYDEDLKGEVIYILNAIVKKGMDCSPKFEIVQSLNLIKVFGDLLTTKLSDTALFNLCDALNSLGLFLFENQLYSKENQLQNPNENLYRLSVSSLIQVFKYTLIILKGKRDDYHICSQMLDFISSFISFFKFNDQEAYENAELIKELVSLLEHYLTIPDSFDLKLESNIKDEDEYFNFRREFQTVYQSMFAVKGVSQFLISNINVKLEKIKTNISACKLNEIELPLFLLICLNQTRKDSEEYKLLLAPVVNALTNAFVNIPSEIVLIQYHDFILRFIQYYSNDKSLLTYVLDIYLGPRGILYPNLKLGSKFCEHFVKFLDKTKSSLEFIAFDTALKIKNIINDLVESKNFECIVEYSNLFNAMGTLITQSYFQESAREQALLGAFSSVFTILGQFGTTNEGFLHCCKVVTSFFKCFSTEVTPGIKVIIKDFFKSLMSEFYLKLENRTSTTKMALYPIVQKLVYVLGIDCLSYLEYFLDTEYANPDIDTFDNVLKLIQNSVSALRRDFKPIIQKTMFHYYSALKVFPLPVDIKSYISTSTIQIYYNFTKLLTGMGSIFEVFFEDGFVNISTDELINFEIYVGKNTIDYNTKKNCAKFFCQIASYFIQILPQTQGNEEKLLYIKKILTVVLNGSIQIFSNLQAENILSYYVTNEVMNLHSLIAEKLQNLYVLYLDENLNGKASNDFLGKLLQELLTFAKTKKLTDNIQSIFKELVDAIHKK